MLPKNPIRCADDHSLTLSIEQIIEYYGARWKIESGFKKIKQDIGSSKSQVRNADAVLNHLNFRSLRLPV
ncbi:MAG: transposase [Desulfocapsa sp.]|uniref:Transposase n=1 Tax=Desulfotalea psychrophila TaxID=84980 RepID=A0ABS3AUD2_9BACT|nr:transposase [Desulfocapsa sp.]MBN4068388.1 transposase [Desulfotalea psychrophila]